MTIITVPLALKGESAMQKKTSTMQLSMAIFLALLGVLLFSTTVPAAETWISCTPVRIMNYKERVHVNCAASIGGISYFAAPTQDSQFAARVLSVISTAQVAGRTLTILYDPADLGGVSIGCQTNDCRLIRAVGFGQ